MRNGVVIGLLACVLLAGVSLGFTEIQSEDTVTGDTTFTSSYDKNVDSVTIELEGHGTGLGDEIVNTTTDAGDAADTTWTAPYCSV